MMKTQDTKGFGLVEALVAFVILMIILTAVLNLFAQGTRAIAKTKINRQISECATLLVEYLASLPPDVIFTASPMSVITSYFDQDEPFYDLKDFLLLSVNSQKCVDMSADPHINLRFEICPSCEYGCTGGAANCSGVGASAQCLYDLTIRFSWDSPFPSQSQNYENPRNTSTYRFKRFTRTLQNCLTAGCPVTAAGEGLDDMNCTLPSL
ncbi:MAG: type II secretion system protein [bacterium]